jgi:hypothetical protein
MTATNSVRGFWNFQQGFAIASTKRGLFDKAKALGLTLPPAEDVPTHLTGDDGGIRPNPAAQGQLVQVDPRLAEVCREMAAKVAPALVATTDRVLGSLAFAAAKAWPVRSGLSRALLSFRIEFVPPYLIGTIESGAPYTRYIDGQPFRKLVDNPGREAAETIGRACVDELAEEGRRV